MILRKAWGGLFDCLGHWLTFTFCSLFLKIVWKVQDSSVDIWVTICSHSFGYFCSSVLRISDGDIPAFTYAVAFVWVAVLIVVLWSKCWTKDAAGRSIWSSSCVSRTLSGSSCNKASAAWFSFQLCGISQNQIQINGVLTGPVVQLSSQFWRSIWVHLRL